MYHLYIERALIMNIADYIKSLRENKGFSQRKLSYLSDVSNTEISRIEKGERLQPSPEVLSKLAPHLGVTKEELMSVAGYIDPTSLSNSKNIEIIAAHRPGDPMADLPEEALKELENLRQYVINKYQKKPQD